MQSIITNTDNADFNVKLLNILIFISICLWLLLEKDYMIMQSILTITDNVQVCIPFSYVCKLINQRIAKIINEPYKLK